LSARNALSASFHILRLTFSIPGVLIGFYSKRRRAVRRFREEMIACGIPPDEAWELSEMYNIGIRDILRQTRQFSEA
jgi:hypothetical protein